MSERAVEAGRVGKLGERIAGGDDGRLVIGADHDDVGAVDRDVIGVETTPPWPSSTCGDIVEGQRLAIGDEVELVVGDAVGPGRRTIMGIAGRPAPRSSGTSTAAIAASCAGVKRRGDVVALGIEISERLGRRDRRAHDRTVSQVDVGEGDGARHGIDRRYCRCRSAR